MNGTDRCWSIVHWLIYPYELEIKDTPEYGKSASYLDILLNIDPKDRMTTSLYDKRNDFDFAILNFFLLRSNTTLSNAYGMYICRLIRYARECFAYDDVSKRCKLLTAKLILQSFNGCRLNKSFRRFYWCYNYLVGDYKLSLANMLNDMLHTIYYTVISILPLTTGNPVYLISTKGTRRV
jgi:hypothetical protein